jgi:integrase
MKSDIKDGVLTLNRVIVDVDKEPVIKDDMKEYARTRQHAIPEYIMELINKVEGDFIVPLNASQIDYSWRMALKKAGLPHMRFHDLRAVNATVMSKLGIPDKYAMERGGWITDETMKAHYQGVFTAERVEVDKKINTYFKSFIT